MAKCICFSRVSSDAQHLTPQNEKIIEEAMRRGYAREDIILIDNKESAVKLSIDERIGIAQLKECIEHDSTVNCVVVYELSRLSRRPADLYQIRDYLVQNGINLISINPPMVLLNEDGALSDMASIIFGIFGSLAEQEGYLRKARIKKSVDRNRALGLHTGGQKMFGYTTNKHHEFIVDEEQAKVVKEIFDMYINDRMSIRKIAKELYDRGLKMSVMEARNQRATYLTMCQNVNTILHRTEYYGAVKGKPAIITKETYDKAQEVMSDRIICADRKEVRALLKGMIYDKSNGGYLLSANSSTRYYYSKRFKGSSVSFEAADRAVIEWVNQRIDKWTRENNESLLASMREQYKTLWDKENAAIEKKRAAMESRDRLEERIVMGKVSAKLAEQLEKKIDREISELTSDAMKFNAERRALDDRMVSVQSNTPQKIDDTMTVEEKAEIVKQIVSKIYMWRESRTIACLEIVNVYGASEVVRIDTYHKKVINP